MTDSECECAVSPGNLYVPNSNTAPITCHGLSACKVVEAAQMAQTLKIHGIMVDVKRHEDRAVFRNEYLLWYSNSQPTMKRVASAHECCSDMDRRLLAHVGRIVRTTCAQLHWLGQTAVDGTAAGHATTLNISRWA